MRIDAPDAPVEQEARLLEAALSGKPDLVKTEMSPTLPRHLQLRHQALPTTAISAFSARIMMYDEENWCDMEQEWAATGLEETRSFYQSTMETIWKEATTAPNAND